MNNNKTKNNKKQNTEELKSTSVFIRGTLTDAMFGKRSFAKGSDSKEKYRISIKALPEDMEKLVEAAEPYYENTDDAWIPKWFKDENAREYLNVSSNYDIKAGLRAEDGTIQELGNLMDYIADNGNINGSKVVLMVILKEGAIYPQSLLIKELHQTTISDMFMEFEDELPW